MIGVGDCHESDITGFSAGNAWCLEESCVVFIAAWCSSLRGLHHGGRVMWWESHRRSISEVGQDDGDAGAPETPIPEHIQQNSIDLVIIGTIVRSGLAAQFLRS